MIVIQAAVKLVGSRFGDGIYRGAAVNAVLRGEGAGLQLEFLKRVGKRKRQVQIVVGVVMQGAIQQVG